MFKILCNYSNKVFVLQHFPQREVHGQAELK